jgi:hypothetical protein
MDKPVVDSAAPGEVVVCKANSRKVDYSREETYKTRGEEYERRPETEKNERISSHGNFERLTA